MKVGFIFECQPKGPDEQIYTEVAKDLCPHFEILPENISSLNNKPAVLNESALDVQVMIESGCEYVFVIWDRMPKWGRDGRCETDRTTLTNHLKSENIDLAKVIMCCIDEMLESWLIADGRGVTNYFQGLNYLNPDFPDRKRRQEQTSPKDQLKKYNGRYEEYKDNLGILRGLKKDYSRAARWNTSFDHFVSSINQICK